MSPRNPSRSANPAPLLRLQGIGKSFFGVRVLRGVNLSVEAARIVGLVGENGAGKSTLMNILGGNLRPDAGEMSLENEPYEPKHPTEAAARGIAFVHQELNLFPNLSIAENLFLTSFPRRFPPFIARRPLRQRTAELLREVGLNLSPETLVERLSTGERQLVEIAKALSFSPRLIILDEPTTSLSARETDHLVALMQRLRERGVAMIYISHILGDVLRLCDDILVLRDGEVVGQGPRAEFTSERMISLMVGRELNQLYPARVRKTPDDDATREHETFSLPPQRGEGRGEEWLHPGEPPERALKGNHPSSPTLLPVEGRRETQAERLPGSGVQSANHDSEKSLPVGGKGTRDAERGSVTRSTPTHGAIEAGSEPVPLLELRGITQPHIVRDISFTLHKGEVLGLSGLMGAGRSELARIIFGLDPYAQGEILLNGKSLPRGGPRQRIQHGLALVTEDRREEGLFTEATVADNMALVFLGRHARTPLKLLGTTWRSQAHAMRDKVRLSLSVREEQPVKTLSGGNQQKVVLGKWLLAEPRLFILDEPTRGIDVGARFEIYQLIHQLADGGAGVLLISSEMDELIGICDRILVMSQGEIRDELRSGEFDRERLLRAALLEGPRTASSAAGEG